MPLFQKSVLNKFIKSQDSAKIEVAYQRFSDIFLQADRQAEIRSMKEEEYQDGFLDDLFVNILGYIKRPNAGFNLVREKKNEADSKKADGAILKNDTPLAVIELKGTDTTDLDKVTNQGFGYKNNHKECVYVVISNFEKLRFFIHHAVEYIEFNLFTLTKEEFTTLWLCLHSDNLLDNIPAKIKAESVVIEEDITKNLYKDYSSFKQELWQDIVRLNPNGDPLNFYKKTQKLIDRFLFIFFAEDAGLLPPNSISRMVDRWKMLKEEDAYKPLYEIFKQYFGYINTGRKGKTSQDDIFAYNGGLMAEDEILETISISDDVLLKHVSRLTTYDFSSEVDVNILGHIFENSLNDIEAVTAELEGQEIDKSKTKRKKDGVFYTPKYITKYIVDNTVGKLCDEKKVELNIVDEEYAKGRTNRKKETLKQLDENLQAYRNWLLNITICDPACGSGAFLNQALEYLMEEHRYIDELESQLLGAGFTFPGVENHILENNIFGVDINEESIEIAKLSLWLRTAQRGRKLTSLNNNIKCGNSLIDDPKVAGNKAFSWEKEFPEVFVKGGFDVIIGNPPYGAKLDLETIKYIENHFKSFEYQVNSYVTFYERGIDILRIDGILGYITPATFTYQHYFKKIRGIFDLWSISSIAKYFYEVFDDAEIGDSVSWIIQKTPNSKRNIDIIKCKNKNQTVDFVSKSVHYDNIINPDGTYNLNESGIDVQSLLKKGTQLGNLCQIVVGIKPYQTNKGKPKQTKEVVESKIFTSDFKKDDTYINCIIGKDFHRYRFLHEPKMHLSYGEWLAEPRGIAPFFEDEKIIIRQTADSLIGTIDNKKRINLNNVYNIGRPQNGLSIKYILALLNSKLINILYQNIAQEKGKLFAEVKKVNLEKLPIVIAYNKFSEINQKVTTIINSNELFNEVVIKFIRYIESQFLGIEINKKIYSWYEIEFGDFNKEMKNAIKLLKGTPLTKKDEFEWMELFEENKKKALELKSQIDQTDKEIDRMVYELYGLTEEEIQIVESS